MSTLADIGLPQGLPEMLTAASTRWKADDGKTYEYNPWFHSYREVDEHREMTAADLGLVQCSERNYIIEPRFYGYTLNEMLEMCDHATLRQAIICLAEKAGLHG
jgi:hypothetical protein